VSEEEDRLRVANEELKRALLALGKIELERWLRVQELEARVAELEAARVVA